MGMNWIKQIFGIKPNEEWPDGPSVLDIMGEKHKMFKNATPTNELVISATSNDKAVELNDMSENSLKKMTKNQLEELAKSELGIELDKRDLKANLIKQILDAK
jgi:hypothetical protein